MNEIQKKLLEIIDDLPEKEVEQVITFAEFLVYQKNKEIEEIGDKAINKNMVALKELAKL